MEVTEPRRRWHDPPAVIDELQSTTGNDFTDMGDRAAQRAPGTCQRIDSVRADGKEQLVVLSARQHEGTTRGRSEPGESPRTWHPVDTHFRRNLTGGADPITIDQKTVAEIDHRRRESAARQRLASAEPRHRAPPARDGRIKRASVPKSAHTECGRAERAGHEELIAHARVRTTDRASRSLTEESNRQGELSTTCEIPSPEHRPDAARAIARPTDDVSKPGRWKASRCDDRQQRSHGTPAHGRDVTGVHFERSPSERARAQPRAAKVHAFDQRVGRQEQWPPTGRDDGGVISRADQHTSPGRHQAANLLEQSTFAAVGERLSQTSP